MVAAALLLCGNLAIGFLTIRLTGTTHATALWWPGAGIGALTLMLLPRTWWWWLVLALEATFLVASLLGGRPLGAAISLSLVSTTSAAVLAAGMYRFVGRRITTVPEYVRFLGIALVSSTLAAIGVATVAATMLGGDFAEDIQVPLTAYLAAMVLIVPLGTLPPDKPRGPGWLLTFQAVTLVAASAFTFGPNQELWLGFLPLLFLIWAAVSFGCQVVSVELVILSVVVNIGNFEGWGPFAAPAQGGSVAAHLYMVSSAIATVPLALAMRHQRISSEARDAERRRTETIFESSSMLIIVTDHEGITLSANPAVTALTGYPIEALLGRPFWEPVLPPEEWPVAKERFAAAPSRGRSVISTADGGERILAYSRSKLVDPVTGEVHYVVAAQDITAEQETSAFLQHLLRSETTVAIVGTDLAGEVTLVNAGAEHLLRISEGPDQQFIDFFDVEEVSHRGAEVGGLNGFSALVHEVTVDPAAPARDWTWLRPEGTSLRISMTCTPVSDARGRPLGYLFVARDVTDTRRNQELLHQALERERAAVGHLRALDHAKDDFVSTVSHELRTPLTSIIGSIELLGEGTLGELSPEQQHLTEVIERNAERLLGLANDLLLLATYEGATAEPLLVKIDLRDVVIASEGSIVPLLNHRDLELRVVHPEDPIHILGDADYLERAITNLLTNAIKFTPDGGTITTSVAVEPANGTCSLSVVDSGIGIPAEDLPKLFQRFFRSSNVRADAIQGTGLGLPIVKSVVEAHHGSIEVTSEPGLGSTFTIHLPLA